MKQSLVILLSPFIEATDSKCNHHHHHHGDLSPASQPVISRLEQIDLIHSLLLLRDSTEKTYQLSADLLLLRATYSRQSTRKLWD